MKLKKAEICVLTVTLLFLALTFGYRLGRNRGAAAFSVRTSEETELQVLPAAEPERSAARAVPPADAETPVALVNINSADAEELCTLNGIGETLAARIIAYREESGGFTCIEDITKVSGIGSSTFEKLRSRITVD